MTDTKSGETPSEVVPVKLRHTNFEAIQWDGANKSIDSFTGMYNGKKIFISNISDNQVKAQLYDVKRGQWEEVHIGDWIVKGPEGFYRYHPTTFDHRFEITE